eukprot:3909448-Rhodomonas_salina.1
MELERRKSMSTQTSPQTSPLGSGTQAKLNMIQAQAHCQATTLTGHGLPVNSGFPNVSGYGFTGPGIGSSLSSSSSSNQNNSKVLSGNNLNGQLRLDLGGVGMAAGMGVGMGVGAAGMGVGMVGMAGMAGVTSMLGGSESGLGKNDRGPPPPYPGGRGESESTVWKLPVHPSVSPPGSRDGNLKRTLKGNLKGNLKGRGSPPPYLGPAPGLSAVTLALAYCHLQASASSRASSASRRASVTRTQTLDGLGSPSHSRCGSLGSDVSRSRVGGNHHDGTNASLSRPRSPLRSLSPSRPANRVSSPPGGASHNGVQAAARLRHDLNSLSHGGSVVGPRPASGNTTTPTVQVNGSLVMATGRAEDLAGEDEPSQPHPFGVHSLATLNTRAY